MTANTDIPKGEGIFTSCIEWVLAHCEVHNAHYLFAYYWKIRSVQGGILCNRYEQDLWMN